MGEIHSISADHFTQMLSIIQQLILNLHHKLIYFVLNHCQHHHRHPTNSMGNRVRSFRVRTHSILKKEKTKLQMKT